MELLIEIFSQPTEWNRQSFLDSCSEEIKILHLSKIPAVELPDNWLNPEDYASEAASRLRETYPAFTHRVAQDSGLLDLYIWEGHTSWWWFLPFAERSSLRTPLIELLYWFCLIELVLEKEAITQTHLVTNDEAYGQVVSDLCHRRGIPVATMQTVGPPTEPPRLWREFGGRLLGKIIRRTLTWLLLKGLRLSNRLDYEQLGPDRTIFFTFYPAFFEADKNRNLLKEKLFGTWPAYLVDKGHQILYAASLVMPIKQIWQQRATLSRQMAANNVVLLESLWSVTDLLKINFNLAFVWRYWQWRQTATRPMLFNGVDLKPLVLRELDREVFIDQEIATSFGLCYAVRRLFCRLGGAKSVNYTFEFQSRERAIATAVQLVDQTIPTIGFDISMFTSHHLSWFFLPAEISQPPHQHPSPRRALMPHWAVAYGRASYQVFQQRLLPQTVILAGPIRYPQLVDAAKRPFDEAEFRQRHDIPAETTVIFLAASLIADETIPMLEMVLDFAADQPNLYLLVKFHPHVAYQTELDQLAAKRNFQHYQVFQSDLNSLIKVSQAVIMASSSVGVEAIVLGCMPITFYRPGNYGLNRLRDYPDATFFCQNVAELRVALNSCVQRDAAYHQRKAHWPQVIEGLLYRLDGRENERLYEALQHRGVF